MLLPIPLLLISIPILLLILGLRRHLLRPHARTTSNPKQNCTYNEKESGNDPKRMAPYPAQPIKGRERYRVMMDIRRLDDRNWLTLDERYPEEHKVRTKLLDEEKDQVLQCLPETDEACAEALEEVVGFLCWRYPGMYERKCRGETSTVHNKMTGEAFTYGGRDDRGGTGTSGEQLGPLEIAARLAMEDLSVLMTNPDDEYYLAASASLFPVGWTVKQRIGWTISQLHSPVPLWQQQVSNSVSRFLHRLTPSTPMERSNYFIEVKHPHETLLDTLFRPTSLFNTETVPTPQNTMVRRERQTFRRMPRTNTILFSVRTFLTSLDELPLGELQNLAKEARSWPDFVGEYKGTNVWGNTMLEYCEQRTKEAMNGEVDGDMKV